MVLGEHTMTWLAYQTRAPQDFDGFSTFAVADLGDAGRIVLIKKEHAAWQRARYQSGMYPCEPADCDLEAIISELWARLRTPRPL
jgi:hypothetical protein